MKKYSHIFCKSILSLVLVGIIVSSLSGCSSENSEILNSHNTAKENTAMNTENNQYLQPSVTDEKLTPDDIVQTPQQMETISENAAKWIDRYKNSGGDGEKVILSDNQITSFNDNLVSKSDAVVDIMNIPELMECSEIASMIEAVSYPSLPKYDYDNSEISQAKFDEILTNRNLSVLYDGGKITLRKGIIVQRASLRSLPTDTPFFSDPGTQYYDRLQETEVVVGSGVWVLHESKNGAYCFVQTFHYRGWVATKDIAIASSYDEWKAFAEPESFAVIKAALHRVGAAGIKLDMGVKLPLVETDASGYKVKLPIRNTDGVLGFEIITLGGDIACKGYMPFTMNNFYKQAFKYEGSPYGWGGSYDSVDCSGFVSSVMRTFGFKLPRNVSQQRNTVGEVISVDGCGKEYVESVLDNISVPSAVYKPGHVMLYLGKFDGSYYVIHSPEGGRVVCEEVLDTSAANLMSINKFK